MYLLFETCGSALGLLLKEKKDCENNEKDNKNDNRDGENDEKGCEKDQKWKEAREVCLWSQAWG